MKERSWRRADFLVKLLLVFVSALIWIYLTPYIVSFTHWGADAVNLSFFVALIGAFFSYFLAKTKGAFRKILYESTFSGYIDLLIVIIPLAVVYFSVIQLVVQDFQYVTKTIGIITSDPFPLVSAWLFTFSFYRTLSKFHDKIADFFASSSTKFSAPESDHSQLRQKIDDAMAKLKAQEERLVQASSKVEGQGKGLFQKCVSASMANDSDLAKVYAGECAETRKIVKTLLSSQMAIEHILLRLETIRQFSDVAPLVSPLAKVASTLKGQLSRVLPEVSQELGGIAEAMNDLTLEYKIYASEPSVIGIKSEAQKILSDAEHNALQKVREHFPSITQKPYKKDF
ncbi:MAG: Snf7 family protein [Candidatus Bathyarchaeota archaeon]